MYYKIEWIFLLFPLACLFISRFKNNFGVIFVISAAFFVVYSLSLNGSDIKNYEQIYGYVASGVPIPEIHGEIGFKYIMLLSTKVGLSYIWFRIILLFITTAVLFHTIRKLSPNFAMSIFLLTTMFIIYTISTYRQLVVMSFGLFYYYQFFKGRKVIALIGTALLMTMHISALILLIGLLVNVFIDSKVIRLALKSISKHIYLLIVISLALRIIFVYLLKVDAVFAVFEKLIGPYSDNVELFSFGLLSRTFMLILLCSFYKVSSSDNKLLNAFLFLYMIGMIMFIVVPFDAMMGRLMNNIKFFEIVLIPMLYYKKNSFYDKRELDISTQTKSGIKFKLNSTLLLACGTAFVILINQLLKQDGYTPYVNILFGGKL